MSVTIGDQKFIKDPDKGWMDAKTKQPADAGLIKLLDSVMIDEPEVKKLRVKIDKNVEPVSINGQKFVYDVNQGWIDEKTKVRAPDSLQRTLNMAGLGITGTAGLQNIKEKTSEKIKSGGGTLIKNSSAVINQPLVAMINQLASIDSYLKQQLQNKQIIAANNFAQAKETAIEDKNATQIDTIETPDAKPEPSKLAALGGAAVLAGLVASQFDPVKDALKEIADFGMSVGNFVGNIAKTLNSGFDWLLGNKTKRDINDLGPTGSVDKSAMPTTNVATPNIATNETAGSSANAVPETPEIPTTSSNKQAPNAQPVRIPSETPTPTAPSKSGSYVAPSATPVAKPPTSQAPVQSKHGLKAKGGRTSGKGTPTAKEAERIGATQVSPGGGKMSQNVNKLFVLGGGITGNAKNLQNWDPKFESSVVAMLQEYVAAGNAPPVMTSGYRYPGDQAKISTGYTKAAPGTSRHERGLAVDFNSPDVHRMKSMGLLAKYGLDQPLPGSDPVHIQQVGAAVGGTDPIYSMVGEDGGIVADLAGPAISAIAETVEMGKKLFGKAGAGLIGAKNYTPRDINPVIKPRSADLESVVKANAIEKTSAMADSRTPPPPPVISKTPPAPNINPDKNSPVIESPATESDMSGINYYLERFGFAPAQSEMTIV
jgi:hypothetical protein